MNREDRDIAAQDRFEEFLQQVQALAEAAADTVDALQDSGMGYMAGKLAEALNAVNFSVRAGSDAREPATGMPRTQSLESSRPPRGPIGSLHLAQQMRPTLLRTNGERGVTLASEPSAPHLRELCVDLGCKFGVLFAKRGLSGSGGTGECGHPHIGRDTSIRVVLGVGVKIMEGRVVHLHFNASPLDSDADALSFFGKVARSVVFVEDLRKIVSPHANQYSILDKVCQVG